MCAIFFRPRIHSNITSYCLTSRLSLTLWIAMMPPSPRINVGVSWWSSRAVCSWYSNIVSGEGGNWYRPNTFDHDCSLVCVCFAIVVLFFIVYVLCCCFVCFDVVCVRVLLFCGVFFFGPRVFQPQSFARVRFEIRNVGRCVASTSIFPIAVWFLQDLVLDRSWRASEQKDLSDFWLSIFQVCQNPPKYFATRLLYETMSL